jgi:SHS2 domain-containing protein
MGNHANARQADAADSPLFREFEHTADLGIEIVAPTRIELYRRAALVMASLLVEIQNVKLAEARTLEITSPSDADLMHDLLSELLQLFAADGFIWREVTVAGEGRTLSLRLWGETFDPLRHPPRGEIKAVTYHQLTVENTMNEWHSRIIFDI